MFLRMVLTPTWKDLGSRYILKRRQKLREFSGRLVQSNLSRSGKLTSDSPFPCSLSGSTLHIEGVPSLFRNDKKLKKNSWIEKNFEKEFV